MVVAVSAHYIWGTERIQATTGSVWGSSAAKWQQPVCVLRCRMPGEARGALRGRLVEVDAQRAGQTLGRQALLHRARKMFGQQLEVLLDRLQRRTELGGRAADKSLHVGLAAQDGG